MEPVVQWRKLLTVVEQAPVAFAMFDREMRYVTASRRWRAEYLPPGAPFVGVSHYDFFPDLPIGWREANARGLLGETLGADADPFPREDGSARFVDWEIQPWRDEAGAVGGIIIFARDVTEAEELRRQRAAAEAAAAAQAAFLANMSHEIRTPLTGVIGFARMLEAMDGLSPRARRYANAIAASADTLLGVANDILDLSALESGHIRLEARAFTLADLVARTVDLVRPSAEAKGLSVEAEVLGDPPPLTGDAARLRQVLLNLLTNAVKFTQAGGISVVAGWDGAAERLEVSVSDTGIGIAAADAARLFQRFTRLEGPASGEAQAGAGLGLAISRSLIEAMGGSVSVESRPGAGSTFRFEAPAPRARRDTHHPSAARALPMPERRIRLLLVDDHEMIRRLIRSLLSPFEIEITEADGGAAAVAAAAGAAFDLILMDLQMPGMDGAAATRAIRSGDAPNRATPILAISAAVLASEVERALSAGMNDHIAKPIDPERLLDKIARWSSGGPPSGAPGTAPGPAFADAGA